MLEQSKQLFWADVGVLFQEELRSLADFRYYTLTVGHIVDPLG